MTVRRLPDGGIQFDTTGEFLASMHEHEHVRSDRSGLLAFCEFCGALMR